MINLNKRLVDKESLLRDISELDIYKCYAPSLEIEIGKPTISPLRKEDNPSFGLWVGENNEILFNDFTLGGGDCIRFVQLLFGDTYFEALSRIVKDFGLTDKYYYKDVDNSNKPPKSNIDKEELLKKAGSSLIRKRRRKWLKSDAEFWLQYGISRKVLEKYRVEPISHIFINTRIIACDKHSYSFTELKDGIETYKIYQPFNSKYKWLNNHDDSVWQGWEQLPEKGDVLIITKSLKDVMTINALTGIPAVSLQAESVKPKPHVVEELKERFSAVFIWYDNDFDSEVNWGKKFATKLADEFELIKVFIPDEYKIKDPSDFVKIRGIEEGKLLIENMVEVPF